MSYWGEGGAAQARDQAQDQVQVQARVQAHPRRPCKGQSSAWSHSAPLWWQQVAPPELR